MLRRIDFLSTRKQNRKMTRISKKNLLGEFIALVRIDKRMSQAKLAKAAGVSATLISRLEAGISSASATTLIRISEILAVDTDELLALASQIAPDLKEIIIKNPKINAKKIRRFEDG